MRLARNGRRHPDPQVASVAERMGPIRHRAAAVSYLAECHFMRSWRLCGLYALTHWLFGTNFQDISFLFFVPFITLPINVEVRSVARRITALS